MKFIELIKKYWYIPLFVFFVAILLIANIVKNSQNNQLPSFKDPVSDTVVKVKQVNKTELYEKEIKDSKEYHPKEETKEEIVKLTLTNLDNNKENAESNNQETKQQSTTNTNKTIGEKQNNTSKISNQTKNNTAYNYYQNPNNNSYNNTNKTEKITDKKEEIKKENKQENKQDFDPFGTIRLNENKETKQNVNTKEEKKSNSNEYIRAEIYGDQTIEHNGGITLRLKQGITYNNQKILTNSLLYGRVGFSGNRAMVNIHMAKTPTGNINVIMELFDTDYIEGIYSKTTLDKGIDKTKEDMADNVTDNNTIKGQIINKTVKTLTKAVTNQQSNTVSLQDGYVVFLKFIIK